MPVATFGAVRGLSAEDLRGLGAQILLSNTYHLHERPGEDVVADLGGIDDHQVGGQARSYQPAPRQPGDLGR